MIWQSLTQAHHAAVAALFAGLKKGELVAGLPALPNSSMIGIGHSLGGMQIALQQATRASFDRVAILGWSNLGMNLPPEATKPDIDPSGGWAYGSAALRREFHLADVPARVLASAAERQNHPVSLALAAQAFDRDATRRIVAGITCPVFLGFGEKDTTPTPYDEPGCYTGSNDISFFRLMGSAHCHNFANTRTQLWDRLLHWIGMA